MQHFEPRHQGHTSPIAFLLLLSPILLSMHACRAARRVQSLLGTQKSISLNYSCRLILWFTITWYVWFSPPILLLLRIIILPLFITFSLSQVFSIDGSSSLCRTMNDIITTKMPGEYQYTINEQLESDSLVLEVIRIRFCHSITRDLNKKSSIFWAFSYTFYVYQKTQTYD